MNKTKNTKKQILFGNLFRLLWKQVFTTALCAILVLTAHFTGKQPFVNYTKALGNAIRYEVDTEGLQQSGSGIIKWLRQRFSKETEGNQNE